MFSAEAESYIKGKGINQNRVVLHSDLNNFFASVECLKHKSLKKYPIAVCGSSDNRHGIVLAKNNLAKSMGVTTGQVIWQAKNLCPDLVILQPHYEEYVYYSEIIREIYRSHSDRVEPFGMDEAWIELTGTEGVYSLSDGVKKANVIRKQVYEETGLTLSVGVSDNKTFSKLASDYKKPDAVTVLGPNEYVRIISKLSAGEMIYAGRTTQKRLNTFDIKTIGDIAKNEMATLRSILGKNGISLYHNACGYDTSPVTPMESEDIIKSIGNSSTPSRDLCGFNDIKLIIHALCDKVCSRLRNADMRATVVQIHVRDTSLNVTEKQCGILPTDNELILAESALKLYTDNYNTDNKIRSMGVRACGLIKNTKEYQSSFFEVSEKLDERYHTIDGLVDNLRNRYGRNIIRRGILYTDNDIYSPIFATRHTINPFHTH